MGVVLRGLITSIFLMLPAQAAFQVQEVKLKHLTARLVEDHALPVVSFVIAIQAGDIYDGAKPFLTDSMMDLLSEGTQELKAAEMKEILLDKGIQLSFSTLRDLNLVSLRTTTPYLKEALNLLRSILTRPRFDMEDLNEWIQRTQATLLNLRNNPHFIAENTLRPLMYGQAPWGISYLQEPTFQGLQSITPLDLRTQWASFFTLDRLKIGVCGDITADVLQNSLENLLADLPVTSTLPILVAPPLAAKGRQQIVSTSHPQAIVVATHPGIDRTHKDFPFFVLTTHLLGGNMSSRLFKDLREKQGLVYNVSASWAQRIENSLLLFSFESKNEQVLKALESLKSQLVLLKEKGITEAELKSTKLSFLGGRARTYASTLAVAQRLALSSHFKEPKTFYEDMQKAMNKITLSEMNQFIKNFIEPDRLHTVVVGNITPETKENHDSPTSSPTPSSLALSTNAGSMETSAKQPAASATTHPENPSSATNP